MAKSISNIACLACVAGLAAVLPGASCADDWAVKVGLTDISPHARATDVSGSLAPPGFNLDVRPVSALTVSIGKMINAHLELEFDAGIPPVGNVNIVVANPGLPQSIQDLSGSRGARLRYITPTVYLNYQFLPNSEHWRSFVGVGVNYNVYQATGTSALNTVQLGPTTVTVDSSLGLAAHAGVDYLFTDNLSLSFSMAVWHSRTKANFLTTETVGDLSLTLGRSSNLNLSPRLFTMAVGRTF